MVWQALIAPVSNIVGGCKNKHEQSQAKHKAKMQVIKNDVTGNQKWHSANSWKDEFWTIVLQCLSFALVTVLWLMIPLFLSAFQQFFCSGYSSDWYQYLLFLAVSASFGIRGADLEKLRAGK